MIRLTAAIASILLTLACASTGPRAGEAEKPSVDPRHKLAERAADQAEQCFTGFFHGDIEGFVDCNHPALVETMGGREQMMAFLQEAREEMAAHGFHFSSASIVRPVEIHKTDAHAIAIVLVKLELLTPEGQKLRSNSFMVGLSSDDGSSWVFLDGAGLDREAMELFIPDFPDEAQLPSLGFPEIVE